MTMKETPMETEDGRGTENGDGGGKPSRVLKVLAVAGFAILFVLHVLRGRWAPAAFFVAVAVLFLKGKEIDGWPKPARYLFMIVYAALAVAMLVHVIRELKALG